MSEAKVVVAELILQHPAVAGAQAALADAGVTRWREVLEPLRELPGGSGFLDAFDALVVGFMDVMYGTQRLLDSGRKLLRSRR